MMSGRAGIALVLALLVLVVVEALSTGLLALATQARAIADAQLRSTRAQSAADYAVAAQLQDWQHNAFDTLAIGATVALSAVPTDPAATTDLSVERLTSATYIVRASVRVGGALAFSTARATAIARTLDRAAVIAESNSAIASGGPLVIAGSSRVTATAASVPPSWADSICPPTEPLPPPDALRTARFAAIGSDVTISGLVATDSTLAVLDSVALGGVKWSELKSIADRIESGTVQAHATDSAGVCSIAAAANWGEPRNPAAPCAGYFPLIFADGDLTVSGGAGQGILAVKGTLTLAGGATFVGLIVAGGGVTIEAGAQLAGAVRSRGGYALFDDVQLDFSRCAVARAVLNTPSSTRVILSQRRFIPSF